MNDTHETFGSELDLNKIGTGSLYAGGSLNTSSRLNRKGLAGALNSIKHKFRRTPAANLSHADLKVFQELIGDELKQLPVRASGLNWWARRRIMVKAEALRKEGVIARADKDDLHTFIKVLSRKRIVGNSESPLSQQDFSGESLPITKGVATASIAPLVHQDIRSDSKISSAARVEKSLEAHQPVTEDTHEEQKTPPPPLPITVGPSQESVDALKAKAKQMGSYFD